MKTRVVAESHAGTGWEADVVHPLHMTSTFRFRDTDHGADIFAGRRAGYVYTRIGNPTLDRLHSKIADLEGAEDAASTASGMAAVASVALTLVRPGDNLVACSTLYGGTYALFHHHLQQFDIETRFIAPRQAGDAARLGALVDDRTRFLYMETPANPTLDIVDISLWAGVAEKRDIPLVVDNTFSTPCLQLPLAHGARLAVHSATKYLGGHADLIGGIVAGEKDLIDRIRTDTLHHFGPVLSPFNAWLILRGVKTLDIRMQRHCENAAALAVRLEGHPKVRRVYYPGLPAHPGHAVASRQMSGYGGMLAFELKGGTAAGKAAMDAVRLCTLAVSLGECATLIQHPASMTHSTYSPAERRAAGIADGLVRLSVGIEDVEDIWEDLDRALAAVP
jgi:methionine-gamma-lyase